MVVFLVVVEAIMSISHCKVSSKEVGCTPRRARGPAWRSDNIADKVGLVC